MKNFRPQTTKVKKGSWTVFLDLCKGCGICLVKCPAKALIHWLQGDFSRRSSAEGGIAQPRMKPKASLFGKEKGVGGKPAPKVISEKCNLCQICEINCPDVAIRVDKK